MMLKHKIRLIFAAICGFAAIIHTPIKRHLWVLLSALGITSLLLIICYVYDNIPHSLFGSANVAQRYEIAKAAIFGAADKVPDDVLLINIAYDRELVEYYDSLQPDFAAGNIAITDRNKLKAFFEQVTENPTYKYILCDVRFEPNLDSPEKDDSLYEAIANTPRLVIPMHEGEEPADKRLLDKAGYCDYAVYFVESNFVKYEFYKNGHPSMPLKAYEEITGNSIESHGLVYTSGLHLCRKCVELKFPVRLYSEGILPIDTLDLTASSGSISGTRRIYYNLGSDVLDMEMDLAQKAKNKIIVIGDFSGGDNHTTYIGDMPGAVINYNALCALLQEDHIVSYAEIILLFTLYFLITVYILRGRTVFQTFVPYRLRIGLMRKMLRKKWSTKVLRIFRPRGAAIIIWSVAGIGAFLWCVSAICYIVFDVLIYLFIPTFVFSLLKNSIIYVRLRKASTYRNRRNLSLSTDSEPVAC